MADMRCTSCRGAKQVPKLGGMIGDCNLCSGKGVIDESLHVKHKVPVVDVVLRDVTKAVAEAIPYTKDVKPIAEIVPVESVVKIDPKKAVFKRKKS